jgi:hypothetical protein
MDTQAWLALNERVSAAKGDRQATANLIAELAVRTIDGVLVRHGMTVTDYDLRQCTVTGVNHVTIDGVVWFETTTGMFDGQRLWARKP